MPTLSELAHALGLPTPPGPDRPLAGVAPLDHAGPDHVVGFFERRWMESALLTGARAAITSEELAPALPETCTPLVHPDPRAAWGQALRFLYPRPSLTPPPTGIHPSAVVDPRATIHPTAAIGPLCVIGAHSQVGPYSALHAGVVLGEDVLVGAKVQVHPRACLLDGTHVDDGALIGPGATVGAVGFGLDAEGLLPHVGRVRIGARATLGAQTCVDRATVGETLIGADAHLDNLVQVGHNAYIGPGAVLCGQVGVAGGARVEAGVVLGGQAGVAGHLTIGPGVRVAAQSGVTRPLTAPGDYSGHPAEPNGPRLRRMAWVRREASRAQQSQTPAPVEDTLDHFDGEA